jgi:hypothetical protein
VVKNRGQDRGDIELVGYLANAAGPVPLVLDLRVAHDRVGSSADPALSVGFMSAIASTSGCLHSEFIRILFLETHRETDHFFASSGVMSSLSDRGFFHYHRTLFLLCSNLGLETSLPRLQLYVSTSTLMDRQSRLSLTLTLHTRKLLVF